MIIIIDGYNLLRHIYAKVKGLLDKQRTELLRQLSHYKAAKNAHVQEIIVVFDGGLVRHATRETRAGIVVVFAGQKISADEWIINYVEENKHKDLLVITSDREIVSASAKNQIQTLGVHKFYGLIKEFLLEQIQDNTEHNLETGLEKYEDLELEEFKSHRNSTALDLLMEEASLTVPKKDETDSKPSKTKGQSQTLSKKEKPLYNKLKKLR